MVDWKKQTMSILSSLNIQTSKSKGQNFLIKPSIVNNMIKASKINSGDIIVEIGGGVGILTEGLVKTEAQVNVIEKERDLAIYLEQTYPRARVINGDALDVEWPEHNKVIANLPYSISSQILVKIFHQSSRLAVVMVQKEVAERCIASPGERNYSRISVLCRMHSKITKLFDVHPSSFFPRPKVTSTVLMFKLDTVKTENDHFEIEDLVRTIFTLRRRTLRSVLKSFLKRRELSEPFWDSAPNNEKRVFCLSIEELDNLVTFLKINEIWPI
ncbi:MAG: 16S rRNA (adenine(1518)-N(6)/adenine(1519)-N(6))-dimethyltransferase RsmA [Candidatus Kariarchaeaceae archaeon]|jgi:16S rRNA (adenine1518-N6/adenine1519-N6)-dimethyltransferase